MAIMPIMSVSQAEGIRLFDIRLISVQGTTPKNSSIAVQHWMEVPASSFACIQSSTTTPNLAILRSEGEGIPSVRTYPPMPASFAWTFASSSLSRPMRPRTSERSRVSTEMPACSISFSLKRTVLNAAGRAPRTPTRAFLSPLTIRQVAAKASRSARKESDLGATVCWEVSENLVPYCQRLLHAEIFPQKLSRRPPMSIFPGSSG